MCASYTRRLIAWIPVCLLLIGMPSSSLTQAAGKPTPPQAPLTLGADLNIVATERGSAPRLRAWQQVAPGNYQLSWTENGPGPGQVVLADVDGQGDNEVVIYGACSIGTKKNPEYGYFINVYKQGHTGVYYSSYPGGIEGFVRETSAWVVDQQLLASDLDNDGLGEILLGTATHIGVFKFDEAAAGKIKKTAEVDLGLVGTWIAGRTLKRDGMAAADVDDHLLPTPDSAEIVSGAHYRDGSGQDKSYLLFFDRSLGLKGYAPIHATETDLSDFDITDLRIANTNTDNVNEVWCVGYGKLLASWTVGSTPSEVDPTYGLMRGPGLDSSTSTYIQLAVGRLSDPLGVDQLILNYNVPDWSRIDIYRNAGVTLELVARREYADRGINAMEVAESQLFVAGTQGAPPKWSPYLEVMRLDSTDGGYMVTTIWSHGGERNGNEVWDIAVGRGTLTGQ